MSSEPVLRGVAHGKTIELETDAGLPEGQDVLVVLRPVKRAVTPGEGLKRSFGGWVEDAEALNEFLEWSRRQRKTSRPGMDL